MSKEKKAIMMKKMKVYRSLKVTRNLKSLKKMLHRSRTKQMMQQMHRWPKTLRLQPRQRRPSRLLEVMMRKRRREETKRGRKAKRSKKRKNLNMIATTMKRAATSWVKRTQTGSSTIKRTRMPTKPVFLLYPNV